MGGRGDLLTGKLLLTYREKRGKENRKKGRWKIGNWRKCYQMRRGRFLVFVFVFLFCFVFVFVFVLFCFCFVLFCFVLFFCFSLFRTTEICFDFSKMGIFYREKAFHARKKSGKMTLPPLTKYFLLLRPFGAPPSLCVYLCYLYSLQVSLTLTAPSAS